MFESGYLVRQVCPIKLSAWPREGCPDGPFVSQQENSTFFIFQLVVINFLITLQAWDVNISLQTFPEKKNKCISCSWSNSKTSEKMSSSLIHFP